MQIKDTIQTQLKNAIHTLDLDANDVQLEHPNDLSNGDYSSNIAMQLAKQVDIPPRVLAEKIVSSLPVLEEVDRVEVAGPGFINFYLNTNVLIAQISKITDDFGNNSCMQDKKIMVEYAHPNTHKEMHIGHMRTLIVGESLARIFSASGADVFRANYQGDIGPHVAKAIWGTQQILDNENISMEQAESFDPAEKAHMLGRGYVLANQKYDENKQEIDTLNKRLYERDPAVVGFYNTTRQWSLDYYNTLYERFGTAFDKFYFESDVADDGIAMVNKHTGDIFETSDGAIIFNGEKYGLHKRVFITSDGYPTYEAKDVGLAPKQYEDFAFDTIIHVVGDEQSGYFKVVIQALELIYPQLKGKEYHLPMGMVNLKGLKMSSRTGVIITVDGLIEEVIEKVTEVTQKNDSALHEVVALGAIKYSVLKNEPTAYTVFDINDSININGNSGPYLQYTHARCMSVLDKAAVFDKDIKSVKLNNDEDVLLRTLYQFPEAVEEAAQRYSPNIICNYLYDVAQKYNSFYQTSPILQAESEDVQKQRLILTSVTAQVLRNGLGLLGITAPNIM